MSQASPYGRSRVGELWQAARHFARNGRLCPYVGAGCSQDLAAQVAREQGLSENEVRKRAASLGWRKFVLSLDAVRARRDLEKSALGPGAILDLVYGDSSQLQRNDVAKVVYGLVPSGWATPVSMRRALDERAAVSELARLAIILAERTPDLIYHSITTNFDIFLEEAISALGWNALAFDPRTKESYLILAGNGSVAPTSETIVRVCHPHGVVPRIANSTQEGGVKLVFSELSYDRHMGDGFNASAMIERAAFSTQRCLFYGFSFTDIAVRAWLTHGQDLGGRQENRHIGLYQTDFDDLRRLAEAEALRDRLGPRGVQLILCGDSQFRDQRYWLASLAEEAWGDLDRDARQGDPAPLA